MTKLEKILSRAVLESSTLADRVTTTTGKLLNQSILAAPFLGSTVPKNGEVTLFGTFYWKPPISEQEEIAFLLSDDESWGPSTFDFIAVTGLPASFSVSNFEAVLSVVAQHKVGTIRRLNLFAHGNALSMGIAGDIIPGNINFTSLVGAQQLRAMNTPGLTITERIGGKEVEFTLAEIRKRFAKDARMVLYSCSAAVEEEFLQAMADLLKINVIGFADRILFCPPFQKDPPFKRVGTKIGIALLQGGCEKNASSRDWRMLIAHRGAVVANPK